MSESGAEKLKSIMKLQAEENRKRCQFQILNFLMAESLKLTKSDAS